MEVFRRQPAGLTKEETTGTHLALCPKRALSTLGSAPVTVGELGLGKSKKSRLGEYHFSPTKKLQPVSNISKATIHMLNIVLCHKDKRVMDYRPTCSC